MARGARSAAAGGKSAGTGASAPSHPHLSDHVDRILATAASLARLRDDVPRRHRTQDVNPEGDRNGARTVTPSENAEYEAAKDKQWRLRAVTELEEKLNRAKVLDASVVAAGIGGPEPRLDRGRRRASARPTGLGEGDVHGDHVISYMAPIGWHGRGARTRSRSWRVGGEQLPHRVDLPKLPE